MKIKYGLETNVEAKKGKTKLRSRVIKLRAALRDAQKCLCVLTTEGQGGCRVSEFGDMAWKTLAHIKKALK